MEKSVIKYLVKCRHPKTVRPDFNLIWTWCILGFVVCSFCSNWYCKSELKLIKSSSWKHHNYWRVATKSWITLKFLLIKISWLFWRSGLLWCWCLCLCLCVVNCLFAVQVTYLWFRVDSVRIACQALFSAWFEARRKDLLLLDACLVHDYRPAEGFIAVRYWTSPDPH